MHNPRLVRERFGHTFDYLARVELEVDRNVLELLTLLPEVREVDRYFYEDVWQPQEIQHGIILDQVQQDLGMPAAEPLLEVPFNMKVLGALAHMSPVQDIARCMYYLTGASTERQATLAYNDLARYLKEMGEHELAVSVIGQIKRQEPGHFAFYQMSATQILTDGTLKPWQIWTIRSLRDYSYQLVGGRREEGVPRRHGRGSWSSWGWRTNWRPTPRTSAGSRRASCGPTRTAWSSRPTSCAR